MGVEVQLSPRWGPQEETRRRWFFSPRGRGGRRVRARYQRCRVAVGSGDNVFKRRFAYTESLYLEGKGWVMDEYFYFELGFTLCDFDDPGDSGNGVVWISRFQGTVTPFDSFITVGGTGKRAVLSISSTWELFHTGMGSRPLYHVPMVGPPFRPVFLFLEI